MKHDALAFWHDSGCPLHYRGVPQLTARLLLPAVLSHGLICAELWHGVPRRHARR